MFRLKTIEKSQLIEDETIALEDADDAFRFFPYIPRCLTRCRPASAEHRLLDFESDRSGGRTRDRRPSGGWTEDHRGTGAGGGGPPGALYRLLRGIASVGVFAEEAHGRFTLTPLATLLLTDTPQSWRAAAIMNGEPWGAERWGDLLYSIKTGRPAFDHIFGMEFDTYLAQHRNAADTFQAFMNVATAEEAVAVAPVYDFSGMTTVVDVGGGRGALLGAILQANSHLRGVLFEAPHVIATARPALEAQGVADRCELVGILRDATNRCRCLHPQVVAASWDDDRAVSILQNCHRAMRANGKLLVVERIIPAGNEPFYGKLADLNLLVLYRGRHRTEAEYRRFLGTPASNCRGFFPLIHQRSSASSKGCRCRAWHDRGSRYSRSRPKP